MPSLLTRFKPTKRSVFADLDRPFPPVSTESLLAIAAEQPRAEDESCPAVCVALRQAPPVASEPGALVVLLAPRSPESFLPAPPGAREIASARRRARLGWAGALAVAAAFAAHGVVLLIDPPPPVGADPYWLMAALNFMGSAIALSLRLVSTDISLHDAWMGVSWVSVAKPLSARRRRLLAKLLAAHPQGEAYRLALLAQERAPVGLDLLRANFALSSWIAEQANFARGRLALRAAGNQKAPVWRRAGAALRRLARLRPDER